jgi:LamB porin
VNGGTGHFYRHVFDVRWGDVDFLWGKLKLVAIGSYQHGGNFTIAYNDGTTGQGHVENSGGAGGGLVQQWDLPPSWGKLSFIQLGLLFGWGLVDFDPSGVNLDKLNNSYLSALAADGITLSPTGTKNGPFRSVDPYNNSYQARANVFWVWNPTDNFSMGTWASYQWNDQGFTSYQVVNGDIQNTEGDNHLFSVGIRPYYWLWGPFAIQAAAAYAYLSNNRRTGAGFGDGGSLGIITIAPTIKPRGGFFQGAIGGSPYSEQNYGWTFGVQAETWF